MAGLTIKHQGAPDETRSFVDKGHAEIFEFGQTAIGRLIMEPGWRWSEHVKPLAGTQSCQSAHVGYCLSGRMKIVMDDGEEGEVGPGDAFQIHPGHDAWVVGNERFVGFDFTGLATYAKPTLVVEQAAPPPVH